MFEMNIPSFDRTYHVHGRLSMSWMEDIQCRANCSQHDVSTLGHCMSRMLHTGHSMSDSSTYNVLRLIVNMICARMGISFNANCAYDVHGNMVRRCLDSAT